MVPIFRNFLYVLKRSKGASILNIAGLSVAFAVFLAILIQVNYEYSYNASFPKADDIYRLEVKKEAGSLYSSLLPKPLFDVIQAEIPELANSCIVGKGFSALSFTVVRDDGGTDFFEVWPAYADTNVVRIFDLEVLAGDYRQALSAPHQVFIPLSLANKFFGGLQAVGKTLVVDGTTEMTIAAVYRDVSANSTFSNTLYSASFYSGDQWYQWNYETYYVLSRNTDFSQLNEKLYALDNVIALKKNSSEEKVMRSLQLMFCPLKDIYFADIRHWHEASGNRGMTNILLLVGVLVLIVAAVNFVNFSTALAPSRIRNLNTQKTFGATNRFLRGCVIAEAVLFALLSFAIGIGWCYLLSCTSFQGLLSASLNPFTHPELLFYTAGIGLLIGILAGCYPAFYMTSFSPALVLKGSQALSPRGIVLRNMLVVFQYTVTIVFIIGVLFIGRQLDMMKNRPWGIEKEHVVYLKANRDIQKQREAFINDLRQHPAIADVTFASELIGDLGMQHWSFGTMVDGESKEIEVDAGMIAANFLNFFGIRVVKGDTFVSSRDSVVMVNEAFESRYGFDPMGKTMAGMKVGRMVRDFNILPLQHPVQPLLLAVNEKWAGNYFYIKINDIAHNDALTHIRHTVRNISPNYGGEILFLDDHLNSLYESEERLGSLVNLFGLATVLIALMGVYGLVLFNAKFKAREIGVRKVNGATNWQMLIFLNRNFIRMVVLSFAIACPLAWYALASWLNGFAYRIPLSAGVFLLAGVIVLVITLLTISYQSWKAANRNPVEVLKAE